MTDPFLLLTPTGRDADVIRLVLEEVGLTARAFPDIGALCAGLAEEATAVILSEGALAQGMEPLTNWVDAQPPWSDLPILVLTARGERGTNRRRQALFQRLGNVTLLDRPLHAETLQSAAQAAARSRLRQHRTRTHLAAIEKANQDLDRRVVERTSALQTEMLMRAKAEDALRQSQKMEAVGQLTGGIAHDFNNLLQVMLGNLYILQGKLAGDEALMRHVTMTVEAVDRAAALTGRLLAFARRQPLAPRALDVNALVVAMDGLLRRSVGEAVRVEFALSPAIWLTWADGNQVESGLLNLVINARDAMSGAGTLRIETANADLDAASPDRLPDTQPGQYVALGVTDTGSGMSPAVLERAFEPFFTTKPIGQGTGLGLSQLYGFARQSGGQVSIRSEPGRGTSVTLHLPRHDGVVSGVPGGAAGDADAHPHPPAPYRNHESILVVEDEALVLMLWAEALEGQGYDVLQAAAPEEAVGILESDARIDLLVTDVGLPGMTGRELAARARELRPGLKVLFVTGYAHYAALGPDGLGPGTRMLSKPIGVDTLQATVRGMLDGRER